MIPTWPKDLPERVLVEGYAETLEDSRLVTQMEEGMPKTRPLSSVAVAPLQVSFRVTPNQKARLARFYREDLRKGTLPFLLRDHTMDGCSFMTEAGAVLTDERGRPLLLTIWRLVAIGAGPPVFTPRNRGLAFVASFQLSILPTS